MQDLLIKLQSIIAGAPEPLAALVTGLAGAIPFVEGEGAATIAVIAGVNPVLAGVFAALGNFLCVLTVVFASSGARQAVVAGITRRKTRSARRVEAPALVGANELTEHLDATATASQDESPRAAARRQKFTVALEKYGVPGVSLLGPLLLPTAFTASMLVAVGVKARRVMFWQTIAIVGWTTIFTVLVTAITNI
ncbi:hypothetical protein [Timonella senegalensis]|uniref:hypothetical protein n=1 Tax=Timonella senegalensis TaxID=1465825 RepID=UPI0002FDD0FC|nr:hypothetical protein [Timonella senegalensis]